MNIINKVKKDKGTADDLINKIKGKDKIKEKELEVDTAKPKTKKDDDVDADFDTDGASVDDLDLDINIEKDADDLTVTISDEKVKKSLERYAEDKSKKVNDAVLELIKKGLVDAGYEVE